MALLIYISARMKTRIRIKRVKKSKTQRGGGKVTRVPGAKARNEQGQNLPPGAKYGKLKINKGPTLRKWTAFKNEIMNTPVYFINCHGSVCSNYLRCGKGNTREMTLEESAIGIPSFKVPKSTYILNLTSGDEYCLVGPRLINDIIFNINNFRKILLVNDRKTDVRGLKNLEPGEHSLITSLNRATQCWYPNIGCSFLDDDIDIRRESESAGRAVDLTDDEKSSGVFNLDAISKIDFGENMRSVDNATQSMIRIATHGEPGRMGPYGIGMWYLDDIINHVYKTTGISKGIFVFAGCTSHYLPESTAAAEDIRNCQKLIYQADNEYGTKQPTLDADELLEARHKSNIPMAFPQELAFSVRTLRGAFENNMTGITKIKGLDPHNFDLKNATFLGLKPGPP